LHGVCRLQRYKDFSVEAQDDCSKGFAAFVKSTFLHSACVLIPGRMQAEISCGVFALAVLLTSAMIVMAGWKNPATKEWSFYESC